MMVCFSEQKFEAKLQEKIISTNKTFPWSENNKWIDIYLSMQLMRIDEIVSIINSLPGLMFCDNHSLLNQVDYMVNCACSVMHHLGGSVF